MLEEEEGGGVGALQEASVLVVEVRLALRVDSRDRFAGVYHRGLQREGICPHGNENWADYM